MDEIADSDCFHNFLTSSVQSLKSAHHMVPNPQKAIKRRSFLGIVKAPVTEDILKAEVSYHSYMYMLLLNLTRELFIDMQCVVAQFTHLFIFCAVHL